MALKSEKNSECVSEEVEVKFSVQIFDGKEDRVLCVGRNNQTVKEAIEGCKYTVLSRPVHEYILWAHVKEHPDEVVINPSILLCHWLKENSIIKTEKLPKSLIKPPQPIENMSDSVSDQTIFYISVDKKKNTRKITWTPAEKYRFKNMCVSALKGESLLQALQKDRRFRNIEIWKLLDPPTTVPVSTEARLLPNKIFTVEFDSSKRTRGTDKTVSESGTCSYRQVKKEKTREEEVAHAVSSRCSSSRKDAPSVNPFFESILEAAKAATKEILLSEGNRGTKLHTNLACLVEEKLSKSVDLSKSALLFEQLVSASKSVGRIFVDGGRRTGTCFLFTKGVVLTNYHVYVDIGRDIADVHPKNPKVLVAFNHVRPNQLSDLHEVEVDIKAIVARSLDPGLDYIFLRLKDECELPGLSSDYRVSTDNATKFANEVVTLIGHPDGREKRVDPDCRIFSEHTWRPELLSRMQQPRPLVFIPLFSCKKEIMGDGYKNKMAYHTSLFYGASGSPVFDDRGKVIAMHTCGWVEETDQGKRFVLEFAISMEAIFEDCRKENLSAAKLLFPDDYMDTD